MFYVYVIEFWYLKYWYLDYYGKIKVRSINYWYCCILVIKFGVFNYIIFFSCIKLEEKKWDLYNLKKKFNYFYVRIEEK